MIKEYETRNEMYYYEIPKDKVGCEIGVCRGLNAVSLYHASKPKKMFLIDKYSVIDPLKPNERKRFNLNRYDDYSEQIKLIFKEEIKSEKIDFRKMGSLHFLSTLEENELDWVYLDSFHMYNHIKREIELSLNKVKKGGLIMGHDFTIDAPWRTSVVRAVVEKCQSGLMEMIALSSEPHPSYICRVRL